MSWLLRLRSPGAGWEAMAQEAGCAPPRPSRPRPPHPAARPRSPPPRPPPPPSPQEFWSLLVSACQTGSGIPQKFLDEKAEEIRKRKEEEERIQVGAEARHRASGCCVIGQLCMPAPCCFLSSLGGLRWWV